MNKKRLIFIILLLLVITTTALIAVKDDTKEINQESNVEDTLDSCVIISKESKKPPKPNIIFTDITRIDENDEETINDDFSDFYVNDGDNSLPLFDGTYYFTLSLNNQIFGDVELEYSQQNVLVERNVVLNAIKEIAKDSYCLRLSKLKNDFINIKDLEKYDISTFLDTDNLNINFEIPIEYLLEKSISLDSNKKILKRLNSQNKQKFYDSDYLTPSYANLITNFNLRSNFRYNLDYGLEKNWYKSLIEINTNNKIGLGDWGVSFNVDYNLYSPYIHLQNYILHYYIPDLNLKVTSGSINGGLLSFGVEFEKDTTVGNYEYVSNKYTNYVDLEEDSELIILLNNNIIYSNKNVSKGVYTLKDFVFVSGANKIVVKYRKANTYTDDSNWNEKVFYLGWDSKLLKKGETLFSYKMDLNFLDVQEEGVNFNFFHKIGITNFFTYALNLKLDKLVFNTKMNFITTLYHGSFTFEPSFKYNIKESYYSYKFKTTYNLFNNNRSEYGNYSTDLTFYDKKIDSKDGDLYKVRIGNYYSNSIKGVNFNISNINNIRIDESGKYHSLDYNFALGLNLNLTDNVNFRTGVNLNGDTLFNNARPVILGSIGFDVKMKDNISLNASSNYYDLNLSSNFNIGDSDNLNLNINNIGLRSFKEFKNHDLSLNYNHLGPTYRIGLNAQVRNNYKTYSSSLFYSTSFAAVDGKLANSKFIHDSFVIVHDSKDSDITISKDSYNNSSQLTKHFNSVVFNFLKNWNKNSLTVFRDTKDGNVIMNNFTLEPRPYKAFYIDLDGLVSYTITGRILDDGKPLDDYSTPTYKLNDKQKWIEKSNLYLFTDSDGYYSLYMVTPGKYKMDIKTSKGWRAIYFDVSDLEKLEDENTLVLDDIDLKDLEKVENDEILTLVHINKRISDKTYWSNFYEE